MDPKAILTICRGVLLLWMTVVLGLFPISLPTFLKNLILLVPILGIILFGFYSLFDFIYKVINLKDCPQCKHKLNYNVKSKSNVFEVIHVISLYFMQQHNKKSSYRCLCMRVSAIMTLLLHHLFFPLFK